MSLPPAQQWMYARRPAEFVEKRLWIGQHLTRQATWLCYKAVLVITNMFLIVAVGMLMLFYDNAWLPPALVMLMLFYSFVVYLWTNGQALEHVRICDAVSSLAEEQLDETMEKLWNQRKRDNYALDVALMSIGYHGPFAFMGIIAMLIVTTAAAHYGLIPGLEVVHVLMAAAGMMVMIWLLGLAVWFLAKLGPLIRL